MINWKIPGLYWSKNTFYYKDMYCGMNTILDDGSYKK